MRRARTIDFLRLVDGIDLITELRGNPNTKDLPVVLVTAVSTPNITLRAIELGVKYRLTKPWEQSELDFVLERSLNLNPEESNTAKSHT
ncbi:MAG: response regulator [SAR202 cluster bacterium]|nr:response regulator [SAR202 cluster bacterium]MQG71752.1 response regulator [SAR202 cluster bacterium]